LWLLNTARRGVSRESAALWRISSKTGVSLSQRLRNIAMNPKTPPKYNANSPITAYNLSLAKLDIEAGRNQRPSSIPRLKPPVSNPTVSPTRCRCDKHPASRCFPADCDPLQHSHCKKEHGCDYSHLMVGRQNTQSLRLEPPSTECSM
jgi:hypothetical protein